MEQLKLNFEAGLTEQFPHFNECVRASVSGCGRQQKAIAADLDLASSMLGRMLNEGDPTVNFPLQRLPELIAATGDLRPIFWLIEKFCEDEETKQKRALAELPAALDSIQKILKVLGQ